MSDIIIYATLTNPYARIIRVKDGYQCTAATGAVAATVAWANQAVAGTVDATYVGGAKFTIPAALPTPSPYASESYDFLVYNRAGATAASSDTLVLGKRINWKNGAIVGEPISL